MKIPRNNSQGVSWVDVEGVKERVLSADQETTAWVEIRSYVIGMALLGGVVVVVSH